MQRMFCIRRQHKRILTTILLASLLLLVTVVPVLAYPSMWTLGVPNKLQEQGQWCWAASSVSILGYYGKNIGQCEFVGWVKGTNPNCANVAAQLEEAQSGLQHWGVCSTARYSALTFDEVIGETHGGQRPVYVILTRLDNTSAHAVVCDGYDTTGQYVYYMDPAIGAHRSATYVWFKGGPGSGADHA